jgi:hypothetical protein
MKGKHEVDYAGALRKLEDMGLISKVAERAFIKRDLHWLGEGSNEEPAHV